MFRHNFRAALIGVSIRGVTLLEMLIAIAITAAVAVPAFFMYQGGLKSSVTGVVSLDMLAEGRRITRQINDDLKNSCIPYYGAFSLGFTDLLSVVTSGTGAINGAEFSLYRFSREPVIAKKSFLPTSRLLRPLISVRYSLEKNGGDLFKLVRIETARGAPDRIKVLSERVSILRIDPVHISGANSSNGWLWNISLQLAHVSDNVAVKSRLVDGNRDAGVFVMDFYDVVYSEFFSAICRHPFAVRNWNSGLTYSPN